VILEDHLIAHGSSLVAFEEVIAIRERQERIPIMARTTGYWSAPDLNEIKSWFKIQQAVMNQLSGAEVYRQVGYRLLVTPGTFVRAKEIVAEVRAPKNTKLTNIPDCLAGRASAEPTLKSLRATLVEPK